VGFVRQRSLPSLLAGGGSGLLLLMLGFKSAAKHKAKEGTTDETNGSLAIAAVLTAVMGKRFNATGKFMPAGLVAALSALMVAFYLKCLGRTPPPRGRSTTESVPGSGTKAVDMAAVAELWDLMDTAQAPSPF